VKEVPVLRSKRKARTGIPVAHWQIFAVVAIALVGATWAIVAYVNAQAETTSTAKAGAVKDLLDSHKNHEIAQFDALHKAIEEDHEQNLKAIQTVKEDTAEIKKEVKSNCDRLSSIEKAQAVMAKELELRNPDLLKAPVASLP